MTKKHEIRCLPRVFVKGLLVTALAFLMAFGLNSAMQTFLDAELDSVQAANARAAERAAQLEEALLAAENEAAAAVLKAEIAIEKAEQFETFYQRYKRTSGFSNYGKFYELFYNTYDADTFIIGTSHAAYGVNPLYLEEACLDRSFFNFATDGTNPEYYLAWWEVFLESGYPMPDTIIYCVDWFMCDQDWLWRRITTDSKDSGALNVIRQLKQRDERRADAAAEETAAPVTAETVMPEETMPVTQASVTEEEKINFFDLDALTDHLFNRIPIIYARDRIPEMIAFYLNGASFAVENVDITHELEEISASVENMELPEMPVYEHEYLKVGAAVISSYYKGFVPVEKTYSDVRSSRGYTNYENQWAAFEKLLDIFAENDIHVIFVEVPEHIKGRYINGDKNSTVMEDNNARIREIAERYGITFLNYNEELASAINDDYTNFYDWGHMNQKGSTAFSQMLAQDMRDYFAEEK